MNSDIIINSLKNSWSFEEYVTKVTELHENQKATSFSETDHMLEYSILGLKRTQRIFKTYKPSEKITSKVNNISEPQTWIVITESWCGDASQTLPLMAKLASLNTNINFRIVLREENPELMELYLTDGGKSIPILIAVDQNNKEQFHWGPRPKPVQEMVISRKNTPNPTMSYLEFSTHVQKWYNKDKAQTFETELIQLL